MSLQIRNINGTTRDATKSARARNGFRTVPNKALRRVGRVVGAIGAIAGAAGTYVAYESAYETCRTASAELGKVTPRAQHVGWFFCVGANTFVAIAGAAGCFFGRGALCGPTKKQIANRMQDELLLQVMLYTPAPVQVGVTPRGERVMRLQTPAPSGLTHLNHLNRAFSRRGKKTQKMEPPTSWTHGNSSGGRGKRVAGVTGDSSRERMQGTRSNRSNRSINSGGIYESPDLETSSGDAETSGDDNGVFDLERGPRAPPRGFSEKTTPAHHPAAGQGGWETWKASFWKATAGAGAVSAAVLVPTGTGNGSRAGGGVSPNSDAPRDDDDEHVAYRSERDAISLRLNALVKSPDTKHSHYSRPALGSGSDAGFATGTKKEDVDFDRRVSIGARTTLATKESPGRYRASSRLNKHKPRQSPTLVYELSSSDVSDVSCDDGSGEPPQSPLVSPEGRGFSKIHENENATSGFGERLSLRQKATQAAANIFNRTSS